MTSTDLARVTPSGDELAARMTFARALADAGTLPPAYRKRPADLLLAIDTTSNDASGNCRFIASPS